jgi:RecB family exonuclease
MPRKSALYSPASTEPFKLSRSKIELFLKCPRTFYLDRRLGIKAPSGPAFSLNSAVDTLLKKEFDQYRELQKPHPIMIKYGIKAVPYAHPEMENWRNNFRGIQFLHKPTNLLIFGAVDDIWLNNTGELHVVDYKSTSTSAKFSLEDEYKQAYKRQADIYRWLFKMNGFKVSDKAYFLFCNGLKTPDDFNGRLDFEESILEYNGSSDWVEQTLFDIKKCLDSKKLPPWGEKSEWGPFVEDVLKVMRKD